MMDRIKTVGLALTLAGLTCASTLVHAQQPNTPSRGFMLERGTVNQRTASVDLVTGFSEINGTAGGIRLGLPQSELILNSGLDGFSASEAVLKWGLGNIEFGAPAPVRVAVYGGIAHTDIELEDEFGNDVEFDYTNLVLGGAFTMETPDVILNFNPALVLADDVRDGNIINLGFGAHLKLPATSVGSFQPGIEFMYVSGGDVLDDNRLTLGARWIYNERITLDFSFVTRGPIDVTGIPGIVRINAAF